MACSAQGATNSSFLTNAGRLHNLRSTALKSCCLRYRPMKNVYEVLRQKELELAKLEKEVEALRVAAPLLSEDKETVAEISNGKATIAGTLPPQQPIRIPQPAANPSPQPARAVGWEDTGKRWP